MSGARTLLAAENDEVVTKCELCENICTNIRRNNSEILPDVDFKGKIISHSSQANHLRICIENRKKDYHLPENFNTIDPQNQLEHLVKFFNGTIINEQC